MTFFYNIIFLNFFNDILSTWFSYKYRCSKWHKTITYKTMTFLWHTILWLMRYYFMSFYDILRHILWVFWHSLLWLFLYILNKDFFLWHCSGQPLWKNDMTLIMHCQCLDSDVFFSFVFFILLRSFVLSMLYVLCWLMCSSTMNCKHFILLYFYPGNTLLKSQTLKMNLGGSVVTPAQLMPVSMVLKLFFNFADGESDGHLDRPQWPLKAHLQKHFPVRLSE